jgi:citronellyl-CoA dehydrogenase
MGKIFCVEVSQQIATVCMQLHGGAGYMKDNVAGRAFVDSRLASIGGGADEVMMQVISRMLGL